MKLYEKFKLIIHMIIDISRVPEQQALEDLLGVWSISRRVSCKLHYYLRFFFEFLTDSLVHLLLQFQCSQHHISLMPCAEITAYFQQYDP